MSHIILQCDIAIIAVSKTNVQSKLSFGKGKLAGNWD